jgi:hypothetical protein
MSLAMVLLRTIANAQIPVEVFAGHTRTTVDVMFFKFFKNKEGNNTRFLFFNRNRASINYEMTATTNLPQFGLVEAFSYNHAKLKGFAPVLVTTILNRGVYPKAGIQFAKLTKDYTIFTWVVMETLKDPSIDYFFLGRYTPRLSNRLNLFTQLELVNAFPTALQNNFSFTQRFRLGLKLKEFQFGTGLDLSQAGRNRFLWSENLGGFLRYEF